MKQIALLPSGCQTWHKNILGSGGSHFVYASTLATYAHALGDQRLVRLQTAHERTITSLSWCPTQSSQYVTAGADMRVVRWSVAEERELASITVSNIPLMVDWAGHGGGAGGVAVLLKSGEVSVWNPASSNTNSANIAALKGDSNSFSTVLRWNHANADAQQLALGRADGSVLIWDHSRQKLLHKLDPLQSKDGTRGGEVCDLAWDPLSNQYLLVAFKSGLVLLLDAQSGQVLQEFAQQPHTPSMLAWLPHSPGDFVTCNGAAATLTLWNVSQTKPKELIRIDTAAAGSALLAGAAAQKKGGLLAIKLVNHQEPAVVVPPPQPAAPAGQSAAAQAAAASAAAAAAAAAVAAAATAPTAPFSTGPARLLLAFLDGSVALFDWSTRHVEWLSAPAHSETIFDVKFKPANKDVLATASFDGTIKLWNASSLQQVQELRGQSGALYALSWCPGPEDEWRLATGGSEGDVFVWDGRTGQTLLRSKHHSKPVYGLKWHPSDKELLVSTSSDGYAVVFTPAGRPLRKFKHPAATYGCDWSPFHPALVATACHDGLVRLFDVAAKDASTRPVAELVGHTARAFATAWSPLLPDRLASASDDKTVRVWDTSAAALAQNKPPLVLLGHTHNVRALSWSWEVPYLLLSGGWDGSIRLWDIRTGSCLHVLEDHHADVYGLASHPGRPFAWVSSSRDTSLRFWALDDSASLAAGGARIKVQAILEQGLLQPSHVEEARAVMQAGSGAPLRLCGAVSRELVSSKALRDAKDLERYARLFDFLTNQQGVKELWKLLDALVNNTPSTAMPTGQTAASPSPAAEGATPPALVHMNDVRPLALANARLLHRSKNASTVGLGKREDRLAAAASAYLSLGHVREFCEIQVELGQWDRALAFAPAASMSYWKLLLLRHAWHLVSQGDCHGATSYFLASGEVKQLLAHQLRAKDIQGAFLSAVVDAAQGLPFLPPFDAEEEKQYAALLAANSAAATASGSVLANGAAAAAAAIGSSASAGDSGSLERDTLPVTDGVREVAEAQAAQAFAQGQPVLAACALLRIGDAMGAVQQLLLGNEILLSLAVCRVLQLQFCDEVFIRTATLCEELGLYDDALKCLLSLRDPRDALILLAARYAGPANLKAEFYLRAGIRSAEAFAAAADTHLKDKQPVEALTALVAAGQTERAVRTGMDLLRDLLSQASWSLEEAQALLRPLHSANLPSLNNPELVQQLLIYSYTIGAQVAMARGYNSVATFLCDSVASLHGKLLASGVAVSCPLPLGLLRMQEASFLQNGSGPDGLLRAQSLLKDVLSDASLSPKLKAAAAVLKKNVDGLVSVSQTAAGRAAALQQSKRSKHVVVPSGSLLPTGGAGARALVSVISRQPLECGVRVNVDWTPATARAPLPPGQAEGAIDLRANYCSLAEAVMLAQCTPYSPNHSGHRLSIYAQQ